MDDMVFTKERATKSHVLIRVLDGINTTFTAVTGASLIFIMLVVLREVIGRYCFNEPWLFTQDVTSQLLLTITFFGASYVVSIEGFPVCDLFYNKFPEVAKKLVDVIASLGGLVFLVVLLVQIVDMVGKASALHTKTTTAAMIPLVVPYTGMLIGLVSFILAVIRQMISQSIDVARELRKRA